MLVFSRQLFTVDRDPPQQKVFVMTLNSTDRATRKTRHRAPRLTAAALVLTALLQIFTPALAVAQSPAQQPTTDAATIATPPQLAPPLSEPAPTNAVEAEPILPHDLTPIGMFMAADNIVKAVMIGLALASVVTWSVWLAKVDRAAECSRQADARSSRRRECDNAR